MCLVSAVCKRHEEREREKEEDDDEEKTHHSLTLFTSITRMREKKICLTNTSQYWTQCEEKDKRKSGPCVIQLYFCKEQVTLNRLANQKALEQEWPVCVRENERKAP